MTTRNYLVTGDTGLIGSHVTDELVRRGYPVRGTHFTSTPRHNVLVEHIDADLRNTEDCIRVCEGIDYVYMCAAVTSGAHDIVNNPLFHVTDNIVMNARMLNAAYKCGVKVFTFISSSSVYPDMGATACREYDAWDGIPHEKYWWVAWMKKFAEILSVGYATRLDDEMKVCIVRPSNTYGPRDKFDPQHSHFIANKIREIGTKVNPLVVWGTGDEVRDYIYVKDLARGIVDVSEYTDDHPQIKFVDFNIASGNPVKIRDVVDNMLEVARRHPGARGYYPEIVYDDTKPTTIPIRILDISCVYDILGFKANYSIKEGLAETFEWYREHILMPYNT